jgi:6-pyruvoyltetrahydropterin/6-carboxytetrahydropterin synthase
MSNFQSTKVLDLGSCAFRQPKAGHSHCRFIHGYKLSAKFWFGANELDKHNWVVDFGSLKGLKNKLKDQFDHTTCIAADDPTLPIFEELVKADACDLRIMPKGTGIERIAEWCFETADQYIKALTKDRCWVDRVEVWEHEKNSAAYTRGYTMSNSQTCEELAEDIATTVDNKQQELDLRLDHGEPVKPKEEPKEEAPGKKNESPKSSHPSGDPKQHRTSGRWVDHSKANKPNSWLF